MNRSNRIAILFTLSLAVACQAIAQHVSYRFTPHYNERVDLFEKLNDLDSTKIVMLGNSLTELGGDWNERLKADNVINRGISGDDALGITSRLIQILPKHPKAIFLMCGTNDLRAGEFTVEEAITNMERIKEKCVLHGIRPIFLTLPPINPANIGRIFGEEITDEWQERFARFNHYLRQQPHIDTAAAFAPYAANGDLPEWLGLDGLHEDVIGKQLIAARVNAGFEAAKQAADEFLQAQMQMPISQTRKENPNAESD